MQHALPIAASHVDSHGWYILLSTPHSLTICCDVLLICFTFYFDANFVLYFASLYVSTNADDL